MEFCFEDKRVFSLVCCLRYARFHQQSVVHATARLFGSLFCTLRLAYFTAVVQATALLFGSLFRRLRLAYSAVCCTSYGSFIREPVAHAMARLYGSVFCKLRLTYSLFHSWH